MRETVTLVIPSLNRGDLRGIVCASFCLPSPFLGLPLFRFGGLASSGTSTGTVVITWSEAGRCSLDGRSLMIGFRSILPLIYVLPFSPRTVYACPLGLLLSTVTHLSHLFVMWCCMRTFVPGCSSSRSCVCAFLYSSVLAAVLSLPDKSRLLLLICVDVIGSCCFWRLPKNSWLGD